MSSSSADFTRSVLSHNFFQGCPQLKDGKLVINGTAYDRVTSKTTDFSSSPVSSMGSNTTREVILLDSKKSPFLNDTFVELSNSLASQAKVKGSALTEEEVVQSVYTFVQEKIFNKNPRDFEPLRKKMASSPNTEKVLVDGSEITCILLDDFAKAGIGVCRHQALATAYLIHRLTTGPTPLLKGIVQQMRDTIDRTRVIGVHVWVSYVNHEQRMHIDTLWKVFERDFTTPNSKSSIETLYGNKAYQNECIKTDPSYQKVQQDHLNLSNKQIVPFKTAPVPPSLFLRTHILDGVLTVSNSNRLSAGVNQLKQMSNVGWNVYDQTAATISNAVKETVIPKVVECCTSLYKKIKPEAQASPKDLSEGDFTFIGDLDPPQEMHTPPKETVTNNAPNANSSIDTMTLANLKIMIAKLESGSLDKETFEQIPTLVKNAIFGKTWCIEKTAGRPTYDDPDFGKHAFLAEGQNVSNANRIKAIQYYMLDAIADLFLHGQEKEAMETFIQLDAGFRNANVYGPMWEACGKPLGDPYYGARAFHAEKPEWQGDVLKTKRVEALHFVKN